MGNQIIMQPDGRYAVFSSNSDQLVLADATADDVIDWFVQRELVALERTRDQIAEKIKHVTEGHPERAYHQFAMTWEEALESDRESDGEYTNGTFVDTPADDGPFIAVDIRDTDQLHTSLSKLSPDTRAMMLSELQALRNNDIYRAIIDNIKDVIARDLTAAGAAAVGVVFRAHPSQGAHYLNSVGEVLFADGSHRYHNFEDIQDALDERFACVPSQFSIAVDLRTNTIDIDEGRRSETVQSRLDSKGRVSLDEYTTVTIPPGHVTRSTDVDRR